MKLDNKIYEEKMKKTITVLNEEFESIRVGRASPRVLDRIQVSYYGTMSDIESVATVKTVDARTLLITPWEAKTLKDIEKAAERRQIDPPCFPASQRGTQKRADKADREAR